MNPNEPRHPWSRLVAGARLMHDDRDDAAPFGFATRVAALAFAQETRMASVFDRFALRALGVACLLAVGSIAFTYSNYSDYSVASQPQHRTTDEDMQVTPAEDPVSTLLDA